MQLFNFIDFFSFQSGNPLNWPTLLKMAKICPKKVRILHFLVGRRPTTDILVDRRQTTDLFHVLACCMAAVRLWAERVWAEGLWAPRRG